LLGDPVLEEETLEFQLIATALAGQQVQDHPVSAKSTPDLMDRSFSDGSLSLRRLASSRLVPVNQNSPTHRKAGQQGYSVAELGSRSYAQALGTSASSFLPRVDLSPQRSRSGAALTQSQASLHEELYLGTLPKLSSHSLSGSSPGADLKTKARDSILWLDKLPQQERGAAMAEMKKWVKSSGLDWDLWWQYCQRARKDAAEVSPKHQTMRRTGPISFGRPSGMASTQSMFNPVPAQMSAYNGHMKSRPTVAMRQTMQVQATTRKQVMPALRTDSQPTSSEGWHQFASEAMLWLQQKSNAERPVAMNEMRQWVTQSGLNWDSWWGYCSRLQDAKKKEVLEREVTPAPAGWSQDVYEDASAPGDTAMANGEETPASPTDDNRATGFFAHRKGVTQVQREKAEHDREKRKKIKAEKEAREEAFRAKAEEWAAEEKIQNEVDDHWRSAIRQYSQTVIGPAKKVIDT